MKINFNVYAQTFFCYPTLTLFIMNVLPHKEHKENHVMPKQLLMRSILITTTISSLAAANPEYPDYIYVDLGLKTIQYDTKHTYLDEDTNDLESRLLFRLNNIRNDKDSQRVNISGWIDTSTDKESRTEAHAWTVSREQSEICKTDESLGTDDQFSWATAISDEGHIAGMTGNTENWKTLHKATAWKYQYVKKYQDFKWVQTTSDPHEYLLELMNELEGCGKVSGDFESAAFGILDIVDKDNPSESDYVITGGCDAGCNKCVNSVDYGLRTFRWFSDGLRPTDVIAGGGWTGDNTRVEHQYALGFLDDMDHVIGQGQVLKGKQDRDDNDCLSLDISGLCHMPNALPTSFDFLAPPHFEEHLDFEEPVFGDVPDDREFYRYNFGILRDAFEGDVAGSTKDNIACEACNDGGGCKITTAAPGDLCNDCYYRAVHWKNMPTGDDPEMLPLLRSLVDPSEELKKMSYFGHGIGQFEGNLQITGTLIDPTDGGGKTNSALVWQTNSTNEWLEPIDLNEHLAQGRIDISDLDSQINREKGCFRLLSAHDVNDQGWIVGQALVQYSAGPNCPGVDFRRPFLLIPKRSPCDVFCKGDLNNDGQVDSADMGILLSIWGEVNWQSDLNCDGIVNGADFGLLFVNWGPCSICP